MPIQKIKSGRVNIPDIDAYIGDNGIIFFDELQGELRLGDGITPGGIPLTVSGGGSGYVLPTASTTVKGGVKVDGTTIGINNQIISVVNGVFTTGSYANPSWITSLAYNKLTGAPSLSSVATSGSYNDLTNKPTILTDTNQLTNGAGFITSSALSGYATETFVTTRGYLTDVPEASVNTKGGIKLGRGLTKDANGVVDAFSGSYNDLTDRPTIPTDISQLTDTLGLLESGGGGTTYVTNNVENPFTFNVAGDDSTLREILNGETVRLQGASGITITTDEEGKITITGPDLTGYATETFVTTRGYLTTVDYSIITNKPTLFSGSYNDLTDKPTIPTDTNQLTNSAGFITSSALTGYATENFVTTQGYLTSISWNDLTDKPNLAGTYSWSIAADDSTQISVNSDNVIKFSGGIGITTTADVDGNITINGFSGSYNDLTDKPTSTALNSNGTFSMPLLTSEPVDLAAGQIALANGTSWDPLIKGENKPYLTLYTGSGWIDIGGLTSSDVYKQILELG